MIKNEFTTAFIFSLCAFISGTRQTPRPGKPDVCFWKLISLAGGLMAII
jgi:hypothetical protein